MQENRKGIKGADQSDRKKLILSRDAGHPGSSDNTTGYPNTDCISPPTKPFLADSKRRSRLKITASDKTIEKELLGRYLTQKSLGCFSLVKPSEWAKTLETVSQGSLLLSGSFPGE